jgi:hypothetical protein
MPSLEYCQTNFIAAIKDGPASLDEHLFDGPLDRVLLGLKAHANTISHARLVALEETFPLTRQALGDAAFNALSRGFVETEVARACDNNGIGRCFCRYLQSVDAEPQIADLAAVEWAWLTSYHAAKASALGLTDIAGLSEDRLISQAVTAHSAAHIAALTATLSHQLTDIAAIMPNPSAILAVRPDVEVRLVPLSEIELALFLAAQKNTTIGNLLSLAAEQQGNADPVGPVMTLIGAGALMEAELLCRL